MGKYVRFVCLQTIEGQHNRLGFINAFSGLRRSGHVPPYLLDEGNAIMGWFNDWLPAPERMHRSANRHADTKALSWFKPEATDYIDKARELCAVLGECGCSWEMMETDRPGYVTYEDEWQIVAIPYRDGF